MFLAISSHLGVSLYSLPFLASSLIHSTSSCDFNSDKTFEIWFGLISEFLAI